MKLISIRFQIIRKNKLNSNQNRRRVRADCIVKSVSETLSDSSQGNHSSISIQNHLLTKL